MTSKIQSVTIAITVFCLLVCATTGMARPQFAEQSGQDCATCHLNDRGGGPLTTTGKAFAENHYVWPEKTTPWSAIDAPGGSKTRFAVGLFHVTIALLWLCCIVIAAVQAREYRGKLFALSTIAIIALAMSGFVLSLIRYSSISLLTVIPSGRVLLTKIVIVAALLGHGLLRDDSAAKRKHDLILHGAAIVVIGLLVMTLR